MTGHVVEHRIVCALHGKDARHSSHVWPMKDRAKADEAVLRYQTDPHFLDPYPARAGCLPWSVELRVVTDWQPA